MADGGLLALLGARAWPNPPTKRLRTLCSCAAPPWCFLDWRQRPISKVWLLLALMVGLPGLVLSGAPTLALIYGLGGSVMCLCDPNNIGASRTRLMAMGMALLALAVTALAWNWTYGAGVSVWAQNGTKEWASLGRLCSYGSLWPAWPLALWTLWRWRKQILSRQLHRHLYDCLCGSL